MARRRSLAFEPELFRNLLVRRDEMARPHLALNEFQHPPLRFGQSSHRLLKRVVYFRSTVNPHLRQSSRQSGQGWVFGEKPENGAPTEDKTGFFRSVASS